MTTTEKEVTTPGGTVIPCFYSNGAAWENTVDYHMFAACCGADYVADTRQRKRIDSGRGIVVYAGHIAPKKLPDNRVLSHVDTKNGPLTVFIRTKR